MEHCKNCGHEKKFHHFKVNGTVCEGFVHKVTPEGKGSLVYCDCARFVRAES